MRQEHRNTITQNNLKQLAPDDLQPGNRAGLFSKEKISMKVDK